jgi:hypothetical protein
MPEKTPTDLMMNAVQAGQQYNAKLMEFAATNTQAALAYMQKLAAVRSPSEAIELTTAHIREQTDNLTAQAKQLAELAQRWLPKSGSLK